MTKPVPVNAAEPLLQLDDVKKSYRSGDTVVHALGGVSLRIWPGEFVAIMGQSGSGKSTLMNMLGCLDRPTSGVYSIRGKDVADFAGDALAALRRQTFGFIFQRYNLLATASAAENVEIPATYAGMAKPQRQERARELLGSLGLGERTANRPGQLSGGQQQRVAIARALMNNPPVILADEPTGALDSRSGAEVMALLKQLHAEGRTIVLITHDASVAAHAARQIVISDGKIVSDSAPGGSQPGKVLATDTTNEDIALPEVGEATKMALRSLRVNLFRTVLTLLGIIIGVASVVTMLAVGNGSKQNTLDQIASIGTDLLTVRPGAPGIRSTGDIATLVTADATAVAELPNVAAVLAERTGRYTARYGNTDYATSVQGTGADFSAVRNWALSSGTFFSEKDERSYAPVAVLGQTVATNLFGAGADPVGKFILLKNVPFEVIGVLAAKGAGMGGQDQDDMVVVPISTALVRLFGKSYVNNLTVKVADEATMDATEESIRQLLIARHRTEDFSIRNMASFLEMASTIQSTLTILLATVAAISLLVGGIGVMNIMLVSVTERTREIGVRMATGARARDILMQFLTEAAVVCTLGGVLGVTLGVAIGLVLMLFGVKVLFTAAPALLAFGCAVATGLVFGLLPARRAARLDPVVALASE